MAVNVESLYNFIRVESKKRSGYELRILYDDNKNGKWDPGIFFGKRQQPELVKPIERRIVVRANWGNEFEIAL